MHLAIAGLALADIDAPRILYWLLVGLIAGALASFIMRGGGYGILGDIIVGLVGAFIGGLLANLLGLEGAGGNVIWSILVALVGAIVFIAILRAVTGSRTRRTL